MFELGDNKYKGLTIDIKQDSDAESPRAWDNLGTMVCIHGRYQLGDSQERDLVREAEKEGAIMLPLYLYDHSGITMNTTGFSCPWDSGQVGMIFVTFEKIRQEYGKKRISKALIKKVEKQLRQEVETYDQYLRGDVYGYALDKDGEFIDSCWGLFGFDYACQEAQEAADSHLNSQES